MNKIDIDRFVRAATAAKTEVVGLVHILREKGLKHFARPLLIAGGAVLAARYAAYLPSKTGLDRVEGQLSGITASVQYTSHYHDLEERLRIFSSMIPQAADKENWLTNTLRDAMRAEGIDLTNISPVLKRSMPGYTLMSLTVEGRATYRQAASWIARLEHSRYYISIESFVLTKDETSPGMNQMLMTVYSAIPQGAGQ